MNDRPTPSAFVLSLGGEVPLDVFVRAVYHWTSLLESVAREAEIETPRFDLTDLRFDQTSVGAALVGIDSQTLAAVMRRFHDIVECLRVGAVLACTPPARRAAEGLMRNASREPGYPLTLIAGETVVHIDPARPALRTVNSATNEYQGSISGRLQAVSHRDTMSFTLHDVSLQRPVTGSVPEGQRETLRAMWDTDVTVHGTIVRDATTGRPARIRDVRLVEPMREMPIAETLMGAFVIDSTYSPPMSVEERHRLAMQG